MRVRRMSRALRVKILSIERGRRLATLRAVVAPMVRRESGDVGRHTGVGRAVVVVVATRAARDAPMAMPADSGHHAVIRKKQKKAEENVRGGDEHRIQQRRITFEESEKLTELTRQGYDKER